MSFIASSDTTSSGRNPSPGVPPTRAHGMGGRLFVISGPSGAGKTSLVRELVGRDEQTRLSVSHTTRATRPGETDGVEYHFVDEATFLDMVEAGEFLEHAEVFGARYGTAAASIRSDLTRGLDVVLEIDWQGARQVRRSWPSAIGIFILPPSLAILRERLQSRGQDSEDVIERRMAQAIAEISHHNEFDYLVVNQEFDQALAELNAILTAARLSHGRQTGEHRHLLRELLER